MLDEPHDPDVGEPSRVRMDPLDLQMIEVIRPYGRMRMLGGWRGLWIELHPLLIYRYRMIVRGWSVVRPHWWMGGSDVLDEGKGVIHLERMVVV
jgi:hypothetical protein